MTASSREIVLYTKGSIEFYSTYPGMYVPQPIGARPARPQMMTPRSRAGPSRARPQQRTRGREVPQQGARLGAPDRAVGHLH